MLWLLVCKGGGDIQQPLDTIIYGDKIDATIAVVFQIIDRRSPTKFIISKTRSNKRPTST